MKNLSILFLTGFVVGSLFAQPGAIPTGSATSVSGTISQFNFGGEGERSGFLLGTTLVHVRGGTLVLSNFAVGDSVQVSGYGLTTDTGVQRVDATSVVNSARNITITIPQPGSETAYSSTGRVAQFNYGGRGEIDGLVLSDGTIVKTPPHLGSTTSTLAAVGSNITITGYARKTVLGKTVVDADTINGQTVRGGAPGVPGTLGLR